MQNYLCPQNDILLRKATVQSFKAQVSDNFTEFQICQKTLASTPPSCGSKPTAWHKAHWSKGRYFSTTSNGLVFWALSPPGVWHTELVGGTSPCSCALLPATAQLQRQQLRAPCSSVRWLTHSHLQPTTKRSVKHQMHKIKYFTTSISSRNGVLSWKILATTKQQWKLPFD